MNTGEFSTAITAESSDMKERVFFLKSLLPNATTNAKEQIVKAI